jgi:hypothetical protein
MTTQLQLTDSNGIIEHRSPPTPLAILDKMAASDVDPEKLAQMMTLCERYEANDAAQKFSAALARFQAKCPAITKRRKIDLGGGSGPLYASLDDIMKEIKPLLADCGLCITFSAEVTEAGQIHVLCNIRHGRHVETSEITLPIPAQMRVNDTQKMGAALSYAKRYALCSALNITVTDEDTDANGLAATIDEEQYAKLVEWFESSGEGPGPTLKFCKVKSPSEIPAAMFPVIIERFNRKYANR